MAFKLTHYQMELRNAENGLLLLSSTSPHLLKALQQMEKLLSRARTSKDSSTMQYAMHPIIKKLIAKELMQHPDMEVNISLACCICDVLRSMGHIGPYNDEQLKDFYEMVVNTFEKLASVSQGCYIYTKMPKVLKTLSSGKFSVVRMSDLQLDGLIVRLFKHFLTVSYFNYAAVERMMMKLMTTIIEEVKTVNLELEDLLLTSARKGDQVAKAVYRYLGRTIPSTIYTRTHECPEGPANIVKTETHSHHGTWDTVNLQGIHSENENITLSSSDVSSMPSKPITKPQSAEHGENLVGSRIKIWWRKDEIYYQGLVKSFDFINKRHKVMYDDGSEDFIDLKMKQWELIENVSATLDSLGRALPTKVSTPQSDEDVWCPKDTKNFQGAATVSDCRNKRLKLSCDHGDEELLDLNGQQWELVKNVSPLWDCMEQDMPKKLMSPQFGTVSVQGYKVKNVNASILKAIFKKHGDIAADSVFKIASVREPILEVVCDIVRQIQTNDVTTIISEMAEIESQVSRAARMDLKTAKERFEKAERCVKVLDLVEKKLHDNFLESKAEKDSLAKQPVLLAD